MSNLDECGKQWTLSTQFARDLLYEGWYLLLAVESAWDDMPEHVQQQARDLRARTEEFAGDVCPLPAADLS